MSRAFLDLHVPGSPLLMPNAWDAGSAKILASLGFAAVATTSSGYAATLGRFDGDVGREEAITHAGELAQAVEVPVSADMENGFADEPRRVAELIAASRDVGLAGASIEDHQPGADHPIYERRPRPGADRGRRGGLRRPGADGPVREPPLRRRRPRRHHHPTAGLPGGRGRRALRARPHRDRRHPHALLRGGPPGQRAAPQGRPDARRARRRRRRADLGRRHLRLERPHRPGRGRPRAARRRDRIPRARPVRPRGHRRVPSAGAAALQECTRPWTRAAR